MPTERLVYRVWEAENTADGTVFLVSMSNVREVSLRQQIEQGVYTMRLLSVVAVGSHGNEPLRD